MAFSLPMPTKKFWLFAGVVAIVALGGLWYAGKSYEGNFKGDNLNNLHLSKEQVDYYNKIVARALELRAITSQSLDTPTTTSLKTLASQNLSKTNYTQKSLTISKKEDAASLKLYGQSVGQILSVFSTPHLNESKIMLTALDTKNPQKLAELAALKKTLDTTVTKLLKLSTPKSAVILHLKLVNNLNLQSKLLTNMEQVFDEPLLALESAEASYKTVNDFYQLAGEINQYFRARGIIFNPTETVKIYQTT